MNSMDFKSARRPTVAPEKIQLLHEVALAEVAIGASPS